MPNPLTVAGGWTLGTPPPKNAGKQFFDDSEQVLENLQKKNLKKIAKGVQRKFRFSDRKYFFFKFAANRIKMTLQHFFGVKC